MKTLKIAETLRLPLDAVTQTFLVVGKRGSGKSNTAARLVEQMYHANLPFVVLDPTDTWWGLKANRDGGRGLDVYVFGGRKADLPLEAGGGALIAEVLCEHRIPMVLSVKHLSGRARSAFMVAFAQTLFQRWAGGPLHVVLEEAHELAPQIGGRGGSGEDNEAAMLGAFKRLWKLGRASGIGGTAVTQRPASLSKDITTQSEILVAHRIIGPQDVKAVGEWVKYHGEQTAMLADLPSLPTGEAFIWAPEFPEGSPIGLRRSQMLRRETYDSASTPRVGEQRVEPKELAAVDLDRLRTKMAATIEKAKADDPKVLRASLAEKDRRIKELECRASASAPAVQAPVPVLTEEILRRIVDLHQSLKAFNEGVTRAFTSEELHDLVSKVWDGLQEGIDVLAEGYRARLAPLVKTLESPDVQALFRALAEASAAPRPVAARPVRTQVIIDDVHTHRAPRATPPTAGLSGPQQRILDALAWGDGLGFETMDRRYLALLADASPTSSSYANNLGALRTKGLLDYPGGGRVRITAEGRTCALRFDPPASSADLQARIYEKLPGPQVAILRALVSVYPKPLDRVDLAALTGASPGSSSYANNLGALRTLGLVDYPSRGQVAATEHLFL